MEKIAIIGNGKIGKQHALAFESAGAEVAKIFRSSDTLDFTGIDRIVVATPEDQLLKVMREIPEEIPTLYEKPLFNTFSEYLDFDNTASDLRKKNTHIAFNRRHYQSVNKLKSMIQRPFLLDASFSDNYHLPNPAYRVTCHWVDMIGYLIGYQKLLEFKTKSSSEYHLSLYHEDNVLLTFIPDSSRHHSVRLKTPKGEYQLQPLESCFKIKMGVMKGKHTNSYIIQREMMACDHDTIKDGFVEQAKWFLNTTPEKNLWAIFSLIEKIHRHFT
tara:strand:- start:879 stop:1694 length:816 start_codon:yes stop_codon:yes gene_type:complete